MRRVFSCIIIIPNTTTLHPYIITALLWYVWAFLFPGKRGKTELKTIAIINQKGGVAKTTTAWHTGVGLSKRDYKVLLVDLDPQTNMGYTANVNLLTATTLHDVFTKKADIGNAIIDIAEGLSITIGGIDFASADREFTHLGREKMLKKVLDSVSSFYDYCIIDTPPTLGVLNENSLTAADSVIIPVQSDVYAIQGISMLKGFIEEIAENSNPQLTIEGILITRAKENTNIHKAVREHLERIAQELNTKVFNTVIHNTVAISEAAVNQTNIFDYNPKATATVDYNSFIDELLG